MSKYETIKEEIVNFGNVSTEDVQCIIESVCVKGPDNVWELMVPKSLFEDSYVAMKNLQDYFWSIKENIFLNMEGKSKSW